jgi:parallel beta-helix repeat protein
MSPSVYMASHLSSGYNAAAITDHWGITNNPGVARITFLPGTEWGTWSAPVPSPHGDVVLVSTGFIVNGKPVARAFNASSNYYHYWSDVRGFADKYSALLIYAHPDASQSWTAADLLSVARNGDLIEIDNNGLPISGGAITNSTKIDAVLSAGRHVWLTADEDIHGWNPGNAWDMVCAPDSSNTSLIAAIKAGNFYACAGPYYNLPIKMINNIKVTGNTIQIDLPRSSNLTWIGKQGTILKTKTGVTSDTCTVTGNEVYVRAVITQNNGNNIAWTQPLFITSTPTPNPTPTSTPTPAPTPSPTPVPGKTITVGTSGNYKTIQAAITAASSGYTILVGNGIYKEHLTINKKLTIKASPGATPVVDGGGSGAVFSLSAGGVWLEGLTIRNKGTTGYGVTITSSGCTVINNIIDGGYSSLKVSLGSGNTIDGNVLTNGTMGVFLYNTKNNVVRNNNVNRNTIGLRLYGSAGNTLNGNYAHDNAVGLQLDDKNSVNNKIYLNDLVNNLAIQARAVAANNWSSATVKYVFGGKTFTGKLGNRYGDYKGSDANHDGVGDVTYSKNNVKDQAPLTDLHTKYAIVG